MELSLVSAACAFLSLEVGGDVLDVQTMLVENETLAIPAFDLGDFLSWDARDELGQRHLSTRCRNA